MYACMYVCKCVYMYLCMCVCAYVCVCMCVCMYVCMYEGFAVISTKLWGKKYTKLDSEWQPNQGHVHVSANFLAFLNDWLKNTKLLFCTALKIQKCFSAQLWSWFDSHSCFLQLQQNYYYHQKLATFCCC